MKAFEKAKWIWVDKLAEKNEYGEFFAALYTEWICGTKLRISCDGDYALWINELFVSCNQYGDFEYYKFTTK